jgi:hypothetical protein
VSAWLHRHTVRYVHVDVGASRHSFERLTARSNAAVGCSQIFLTTGDAAVFNLSLLTSDFFAVVAAKYLFSEQLSSLYFVGFSLIIVGVSVYNRSAPPTTAASCRDPLSVQDGSLHHLLPAEP